MPLGNAHSAAVPPPSRFQDILTMKRYPVDVGKTSNYRHGSRFHIEPAFEPLRSERFRGALTTKRYSNHVGKTTERRHRTRFRIELPFEPLRSKRSQTEAQRAGQLSQSPAYEIEMSELGDFLLPFAYEAFLI